MKLKKKSTKFGIYLEAEDYWECVENNKSIDTLYPEGWDLDTAEEGYRKYMDSVVEEGEQYELLNMDKLYNYAITSYGRLFNVEKGRPLRTYMLKDNLFIFVRTIKKDVGELFELYGWDYNYDVIINRFKDNEGYYWRLSKA
jgi:hypothetical protein